MERNFVSFRRHDYDNFSKENQKRMKKFINDVEVKGFDYAKYDEEASIGYIYRNNKLIAAISRKDFYKLTKASFKVCFKKYICECPDTDELAVEATTSNETKEDLTDLIVELYTVLRKICKLFENNDIINDKGELDGNKLSKYIERII